jgi:predicted metal-binding membrane protein
MLEAIHRHERLIVGGALALVTAGAWAYTFLGAGMDDSAIRMTAMAWRFEAMAMAPPVWTLAYAGAVFLMWWVMMIAMMLPSALPMILFHAAIVRERDDAGERYLATALFVAGYLVLWGAFALAAAGAQGALESGGLLSPMMESAGPWMAGGLLIAAGLYQVTPVKQACLSHCRSPFSFVAAHWRQGRAGALRMGVHHGIYCVGCCWFLMGLLFVGGVMNLFWIGAIALYVLVEKLAPRGPWVSRAVGAILMGWGGAILLWPG